MSQRDSRTAQAQFPTTARTQARATRSLSTPRREFRATWVDVRHMAVVAVDLGMAAHARDRALRFDDRRVSRREGLRVRHLSPMTARAEGLLVTGGAVLGTVERLSGVLVDEVRTVRQGYAVASYAVVSGVACGARVQVAHAVRLLPVRPVSYGPLPRAKTFLL